MCGIFFTCWLTKDHEEPLSPELKLLLRNRGPDSFQSQVISLTNLKCYFLASVLHLRGEMVTKQPIVDNLSNVLLFNGEILSDFEAESKSDSQYLFSKLSQCRQDPESILNFISSIEGPYAFIFYHGRTGCLFFGRDILGRRSLCWKFQASPFQFKISSVCEPESEGWNEVPADGLYYCYLNRQSYANIECIKWPTNISGGLVDNHSVLHSPIKVPLNRQIPEKGSFFHEIEPDLILSFEEVLSEAIRKRCCLFTQLCISCHDGEYHRDSKCDHSSIGVLFSGGLDSTVIALLTAKYIPFNQSIDLLNVAFSNNAPDRDTGLLAWKELQKLCPDRVWNFVSINVTKEELKHMREERIKYLLKPHETVLDDSIGCALWFAGNGHGELNQDPSHLYDSPCRVLLVGLGADEQLGGYSRHRKVFQEHKWEGLIDEICKEVNGISERNLGRDDRIISDHGKEPRFPFLDEEVINFLNSLPMYKKTNLQLERGKGEKILLRQLAKKLGLVKTAENFKRAIQFGSRIAKLESRGEKGNFVCDRLK